MELFGDVRLLRVETDRRWSDSCKAEGVFGCDDIGLTIDSNTWRLAKCLNHHIYSGPKGPNWISKGDIDAERLAEWFASQATDCSKTQSVVLHSLIGDDGVAGICRQLECHEVSKRKPPSLLETLEGVGWAAHHPQVDIPGGPGPRQPELQNQPALEYHRVREDNNETGEEPVKNQQLSTTTERFTVAVGSVAKSLFQALLERVG